ncbi:MAG: hypothetical protein HQL54_13900 [Magnetococcales bacterium]|nr:hypothetical protein [Magnetococcales bacterium]
MKELWRIIHGGRYRIILTIVFFLSLALVAGSLMTPKYEVQMLLQPQEVIGGTSSSLGGGGSALQGLSSLAGLSFSRSQLKDTALAILKSSHFTADFITEEQLLNRLFHTKWDFEKNTWSSELSAEEIPTLQDAIILFDQKIRRIKEDSTTGFITLVIEWSDPTLAKQWSEKLIKRINQRMRHDAIIEAEKNIDYLTKQIASHNNVELNRTAAGLIESQLYHIMMANGRAEYAFKVLDPPMLPELDAYVSPNWLLLVLLGLVGGSIVGLMWVLLRSDSPSKT